MASTQSGAHAVAKSGSLKGSWKFSELLKLLDELANFDLLVLKRRKLMLGLCITCFVLAFVFFIITMATQFIPMVAVLVLLIAGGITTAVFYKRFKGEDIDDDLRLFVKPLLEVLAEDIREDSTIEVDCMVRPLNSKEFNKGKGEKYSKGVYPACYDYTYDRDFLTMKIRMRDDNRLVLSIKDHMVMTERSKTNPRGKTKTKSSYKRKTSCDVDIRVNGNAFKCASQHPKGVTVTKTDKGEIISWSTVMKEKTRSEWNDHIMETDKAVTAIAGLYACLKPAKQG